MRLQRGSWRRSKALELTHLRREQWGAVPMSAIAEIGKRWWQRIIIGVAVASSCVRDSCGDVESERRMELIVQLVNDVRGAQRSEC